jgi:hypothetical protein
MPRQNPSLSITEGRAPLKECDDRQRTPDTNPLRKALDQAQSAGVPDALSKPVPAYHGGEGPTQRVR